MNNSLTKFDRFSSRAGWLSLLALVGIAVSAFWQLIRDGGLNETERLIFTSLLLGFAGLFVACINIFVVVKLLSVTAKSIIEGLGGNITTASKSASRAKEFKGDLIRN